MPRLKKLFINAVMCILCIWVMIFLLSPMSVPNRAETHVNEVLRNLKNLKNGISWQSLKHGPLDKKVGDWNPTNVTQRNSLKTPGINLEADKGPNLQQAHQLAAPFHDAATALTLTTSASAIFPKEAQDPYISTRKYDWNDQMEFQRPMEVTSFYRPLGEEEVPEKDLNAPGELGKPFRIDVEKLSHEEQKEYQRGLSRNSFNQYASDRISVHRTFPDYRGTECRSMQYPPSMPDTSVIVIFRNEAWTVLERTVFSILHRSPPHLLKEVILVDDFSDQDHLKAPLEKFVSGHKKLKLVRSQRREGLIRARLLGASVATGAVLTFLDSHCECTPGWLEPLLYRISQNRSHVVTPIIESIDDSTLQYINQPESALMVGGFDWSMTFTWHAVPDHEKKRRKSVTDPVRSPTMAGGLFSIHKEYFAYLGTYDAGMEIWGGENLELSFRIWMCGGTLEVMPCSRVGHIFRKVNPNSNVGFGNVMMRNSVRTAEVWMDEYKYIYYDRIPNQSLNYGDISARKALRDQLQCKSFKWYIENIYPTLFVPSDSVASGEIRGKAELPGLGQICLDSKDLVAGEKTKDLQTWPCHNQGGNQHWMLSKEGEIRKDRGCLDFDGISVRLYHCHGSKGNQEWEYREDKTLYHISYKKCMQLSKDGKIILMEPCTASVNQIFYWKRKPTGQNTL